MRILPISQNLAFATARVPSRSATGTDDADSSRTTNNPTKKAPSSQATDEEANETSRSRSLESGEQSETAGNGDSAGPFTQLSTEQQKVVDKLKQRDTEVRRHEQAHLTAAGPYASGGPSFTYQKGPDGRTYATGGEVPIDTSAVSGDPEATIIKAQTIRRAALAPAEPSAQDRSVAAAATKLETEARREIRDRQDQESAPKDSKAVAESAFKALGSIVDQYA